MLCFFDLEKVKNITRDGVNFEISSPKSFKTRFKALKKSNSQFKNITKSLWRFINVLKVASWQWKIHEDGQSYRIAKR